MKRTHLMTAAAATLAALAIGWVAGQATAAQPHMQNALDSLNTAKSELKVATHNKGGHRATALRLVNQAIGETEAGIAAGGD